MKIQFKRKNKNKKKLATINYGEIIKGQLLRAG